MNTDKQKLLEILRIAHDTSGRGEGISLREAIARSNYQQLRATIDAEDLVPILRESSEFVEQWLMYCQDKRTSGGYWVSEETFEVGSLKSPEATRRYASLEEAVAEFIVHELDYWSHLAQQPSVPIKRSLIWFIAGALCALFILAIRDHGLNGVIKMTRAKPMDNLLFFAAFTVVCLAASAVWRALRRYLLRQYTPTRFGRFLGGATFVLGTLATYAGIKNYTSLEQLDLSTMTKVIVLVVPVAVWAAIAVEIEAWSSDFFNGSVLTGTRQ